MIEYQTFPKVSSNDTWHFIAGNGFPPAAYKRLFDKLPAAIQSPLLRPLWSKQQEPLLPSWQMFVSDLEQYILKFKPKVVFGHSIGASLWVLAAQQFNYQFEKVMLIEPVVFPSWYVPLYEILKWFNIHRRVHPMIPKTLKRQRWFQSKEAIVDRFSKKPLFSKVSEDVLIEFINASFKPHNNGFELIYSPEWEALVYDKMTLSINAIWDSLSAIKTPVLLLKAEYSDVITNAVYKKLLKNYQHLTINVVKNTTHLLPFEQPNYVVDELCAFTNA